MLAALLFGLAMSAAEPTPVPASPAAPTAPTSTAAPGKSDPDRMICKKESKAGSRFTAKICRTRAEWEQLAKDARTVTRDIQSGPNLPNCNGGQC